MRLEVDNTSLANTDTGSWEDLLEGYRASERQAGRQVPSYSWETIAIIIGGWLVQKLADEVWKRIIEFRSKRAAAKQADDLASLESKHHEEVMSQLSEIADGLASGERDPALGLLKAAATRGLRMTIILESDVDRDVRAAVAKMLPEVVVQDICGQ